MMNYEEHVTKIIKLHLKIQGKVYGILVMHKYFFKGTITATNPAAQIQISNGANKKV